MLASCGLTVCTSRISPGRATNYSQGHAEGSANCAACEHREKPRLGTSSAHSQRNAVLMEWQRPSSNDFSMAEHSLIRLNMALYVLAWCGLALFGTARPLTTSAAPLEPRQAPRNPPNPAFLRASLRDVKSPSFNKSKSSRVQKLQFQGHTRHQAPSVRPGQQIQHLDNVRLLGACALIAAKACRIPRRPPTLQSAWPALHLALTCLE